MTEYLRKAKPASALLAGMLLCPLANAELITFDWAAGFQSNVPTTTFFDVDGSGIDVEVSFSTFTQGNGANNPASNGGVDGTAGGFLDTTAATGSINFDSDVLISQFYWRPASAADAAPVTLVGSLLGIEQWSISTIVPITGDAELINSDLQLTTGSFASAIDSISFSQSVLTNSNRLDDITFTVATIPEPSTFALIGSLLAFGAVVVRRRKNNS
ncbi:MAG: PEP-CTERM sorting domain-containing protein [Verrucomicrobiota bacterium]